MIAPILTALQYWLFESEHVETLELLDIMIAFDYRDFVERNRDALSDVDCIALDNADRLFVAEAPALIEMFGWNDWYAALPDDHYARRFAAEHGNCSS